MKILIIRYGSLLIQQHIITLCNYLSKQHLRVVFVNITSSEKEIGLDYLDNNILFIKIIINPDKSINGIYSRLVAAIKLRRVLKHEVCNILYIIDSWTLPFLWLASYHQPRWRDSKLVYHTFDMVEPGILSPIYVYLEKKICQKADLVVNTDRSRAYYQKSIHRLKFVPLYVRNCLPLKVSLPKRDEALRRQMTGTNVPADSILMVYPTIAGAERLTFELIRSFALLPTRYRLFTIARDDEYGKKCRQLIEEKSLTDRVTLHPPVTHFRISEFIACGDIGAIFHNYDTSFGNYLCNPGRLPLFVALGIPFVASNIPSLEAEVYRFELGVCCDPFSPPEIAGAIRKLVEGNPCLADRKKHLLDVFRGELHYEKTAGVLIDKLKELVKEAK